MWTARSFKKSSYDRLNPHYAPQKPRRALGRDFGFGWAVILMVFALSALLESRAGEQVNDLTPEICAHYLAGPAAQKRGPRYSTYGLGKNPVPATLPNQNAAPTVTFEIAPRLPNHPYLPRRGVAGLAQIDQNAGQALIQGERYSSQTGLSHDEIVEACLALMSADDLK